MRFHLQRVGRAHERIVGIGHRPDRPPGRELPQPVQIDTARIRRARELSEIKRRFSTDRVPDPSGVNSKATVVLAYANWEGFYNECVGAYIRFLRDRGGKIRDTDWMLLVGAFHADFDSLKARSHSSDARRQFVEDLQTRLECGFESFDDTIVEARSNLNFER